MVLGLPAFTQADTGWPDRDPLAGLKLPTLLADAHDVMDSAADSANEEKADNYEVCAAFRADRDADLGAVLKAGCEPTLPASD